MTGKTNARALARERRAENFGRKVISDALVQAMGSAGAKPARAARLIGNTSRNLLDWRTGKGPALVETILNVPEFDLAFARCLQTHILKRRRAERGRR